MDLKLLDKKLGRPFMKKATKGEFDNCIAFFESRGITPYKICQVIDVSMTSIYRWWQYRNITQDRLDQLKELIRAIEKWELENGRQYGS